MTKNKLRNEGGGVRQKREQERGKTAFENRRTKTNNRANRCKEVRFGLNQLPRGKDHAKETMPRNESGELAGALVAIITGRCLQTSWAAAPGSKGKCGDSSFRIKLFPCLG